MSTKCYYCLSRYTFIHPFLWYRQLLLEVIWESLGFFLDRVAAEMSIGLTISIWKWNEWCKLQIFVEMSINCCFELRNFWGYKTYCDRSIYGGEYSRYGKFIGKNVKQDSVFFLTLISFRLQFSVSCIKQWRRTFALKIQFEPNDLIPLPYQFKRQDMRLNLHCKPIDWNEAF